MTPERAVELLKANEERISATDYLRCKDASIEALEKQIPKPPTDICTPVVTWGLCPECKGELKKLGGKPNRLLEGTAYCPDCGQRIDWSDIK